MATLIVHRPTGHRYILLGTSVHLFTPSAVVSSSSRQESARPPRPIPILTVAVCDADGAVTSLRAEECAVVDVDGATPAAALQGGGYR